LPCIFFTARRSLAQYVTITIRFVGPTDEKVEYCVYIHMTSCRAWD